jgi:hypothetical protein
LPEGTTFGFNIDADPRVWIHVFGPGGRDSRIMRARALRAGGVTLKASVTKAAVLCRRLSSDAMRRFREIPPSYEERSQ